MRGLPKGYGLRQRASVKASFHSFYVQDSGGSCCAISACLKSVIDGVDATYGKESISVPQMSRLDLAPQPE